MASTDRLEEGDLTVAAHFEGSTQNFVQSDKLYGNEAIKAEPLMHVDLVRDFEIYANPTSRELDNYGSLELVDANPTTMELDEDSSSEIVQPNHDIEVVILVTDSDFASDSVHMYLREILIPL